MPLVLADRVKETTTTAGTGTVTLLGAATGFQSFAVIGNANTTYYTIAGQTGSQWEVGIGTYNSAGPTLARTTVLANSAGTQPSALDFAAGTKDVFVTYPAQRAVYDSTGSTGGTDAVSTNTANTLVRRDASGNFSAGTITATLSGNATNVSGTVAIANGGTGQTTQQAALNALSGTQTANRVLRSNGTNVTFSQVALTTDVTGTLPVGNGGTGATTLTANNVLLGNGTSALQVVAPSTSGNVLTSNGTTWTSAAGLSLSGDNTWTGTQTFSGTTSKLAMVLNDAAEVTTVSAIAATGTINFDVTTQSVLYYTSNASGNWTLNVRASSGTTLNTVMATGQSVTIAFIVTNGATAFRQTGFQVDGSSVTPRWQGGTAPAAGNASSLDAYVITIIKTGAATFTALASQTRFA
jgi:hypothetical protein